MLGGLVIKSSQGVNSLRYADLDLSQIRQWASYLTTLNFMILSLKMGTIVTSSNYIYCEILDGEGLILPWTHIKCVKKRWL